MKTYDWIVVGSGITGSALSYELAKKHYRVLLLDKDPQLNNATHYSYGGVAYWQSQNSFTEKFCQEGIEIYRNLSAELDADIQFREIDLLLTIPQETDVEILKQDYQTFSIQPRFLDVKEACQLEPLLNPEAIAGAFLFPHGHVNPTKTQLAYQQAFLRLGGEKIIEEVTELINENDLIKGVKTNKNNYFYSENTVICAGGLSRSLLARSGIKIKLYFTHTNLLVTPPVDLKLNTQIMSGITERFRLEKDSTSEEMESFWEQEKTGAELIPGILDVGAIQFQDQHLALGQISQIFTDPYTIPDPVQSEAKIRGELAKFLPKLANLPARWYHCLVAFTPDGLPLVGSVTDGLYLFTGFTNTLVLTPPLARQFPGISN